MNTPALRRTGTAAIKALLVFAIGLTLFVGYGLIDNAWYKVLAVRGGSMQPTIHQGDLIVITRPPDTFEVGQVLTLQVDGAVVTHRVVEVRADGTFVTQGDANDTRDDWSENDVHVVGLYRFRLPFLGHLVDPIVSAAWFTSADGVGTDVASGSWVSSLRATDADPVTQSITWQTVETAPPTPTPGGTRSATPTATATPTL